MSERRTWPVVLLVVVLSGVIAYTLVEWRWCTAYGGRLVRGAFGYACVAGVQR